MANRTKKPINPREHAYMSKQRIESEMQEAKDKIIFLQALLDTNCYLDFSICKYCGGSGWYWGGSYGQERKNCKKNHAL